MSNDLLLSVDGGDSGGSVLQGNNPATALVGCLPPPNRLTLFLTLPSWPNSAIAAIPDLYIASTHESIRDLCAALLGRLQC
jgi:hypothetical protein